MCGAPSAARQRPWIVVRGCGYTASETQDLLLVDRTLAMQQQPLRVLLERRVAQDLQYAPPLLLAVRCIDAAPRVVEDPVHELVLLDQLRLGGGLRVSLAHADQQQHATDEVHEGSTDGPRDPCSNEEQYRQRRGSYPQSDPAHALREDLVSQPLG